MTDPISVAAAYTIVLGGLSLYVMSIVRRARATRQIARALEGQQARDDHELSGAAGTARVEPAETGR